jgi:hypothetical protein
MPVGYGYKESGDAGYVNWAEVAKGFTDMLGTENKRREDLKAEYDKQDRELANTLANAPMGQYKDGNDFTSNYVEAMTKQRLIDVRLFKRGLLKEKDYILKTNNAIDGTNTLFDLQKKYQEQYKTKMDGINSGKLQAINGFNMSTTEGFADFSKSRAVLDPSSGQVKLMKMKFNEETGILEPTEDIVPVGTLMRNMSTDIATFDLDGATNNTVNNLGKLKTEILDRATLTKAGSVTTYINSPEMFEASFPGGKAIIQEFNKSISNSIESYFAASPYNLTSILTQNTGMYGAYSFTYDKNEATKDKSKILLTISPNTGLPVMDETGPNYKKQKEEAAAFARNQILSKLDREKAIQTSTAQLGRNDEPEWLTARRREQSSIATTGEMLAKFYAGNDAEVSSAKDHFKGLEGIRDIERTSEGMKVYYTDANKPPKTVNFTSGGAGIGTENFVKAATKLLLGNDVEVTEAVRGIGKYRGKPLNTKQYLKPAVSSAETIKAKVAERVATNKDLIDIEENTPESINKLTKEYGDLGFGFTQPPVEQRKPGLVIIQAPNGKKTTIQIYGKGGKDAVDKFIIDNQSTETSRSVFFPGQNPEAEAVEVSDQAP